MESSKRPLRLIQVNGNETNRLTTEPFYLLYLIEASRFKFIGLKTNTTYLHICTNTKLSNDFRSDRFKLSQQMNFKLTNLMFFGFSGITTVTTSTRAPVTSTTGEVYFSLDEIINQPEQKVCFAHK